MDPAVLNRIRWRCRRGLLELDIILERFLEIHAGSLAAEDASVLLELLELPENDLLDIVMGRSERYEPRCKWLVARLRAS